MKIILKCSRETSESSLRAGWQGEGAAPPGGGEGRRLHRLAAPQPRRQRPRKVSEEIHRECV